MHYPLTRLLADLELAQAELIFGGMIDKLKILADIPNYYKNMSSDFAITTTYLHFRAGKKEEGHFSTEQTLRKV